jgi:hypothetical protein
MRLKYPHQNHLSVGTFVMYRATALGDISQECVILAPEIAITILIDLF